MDWVSDGAFSTGPTPTHTGNPVDPSSWFSRSSSKLTKRIPHKKLVLSKTLYKWFKSPNATHLAYHFLPNPSGLQHFINPGIYSLQLHWRLHFHSYYHPVFFYSSRDEYQVTAIEFYPECNCTQMNFIKSSPNYLIKLVSHLVPFGTLWKSSVTILKSYGTILKSSGKVWEPFGSNFAVIWGSSWIFGSNILPFGFGSHFGPFWVFWDH